MNSNKRRTKKIIIYIIEFIVSFITVCASCLLMIAFVNIVENMSINKVQVVTSIICALWLALVILYSEWVNR